MDDELKIKKRNLPHWTIQDSVYFITFCLLKDELNDIEKTIVYNHIIEGDKKFYKLHYLVVMPDHVHIILNCLNGYTLENILKGTKGVTAHLINKLRGTNGSVWQDESFDRILRNEKEYNEKSLYMFNNPFKKGLVDNPEDYIWWYEIQYIW